MIPSQVENVYLQITIEQRRDSDYHQGGYDQRYIITENLLEFSKPFRLS